LNWPNSYRHTCSHFNIADASLRQMFGKASTAAESAH